jgi:hypothetical protein
VATALHIDGLSTEPGTFAVKPGESIAEVLSRMGATVRVERVPDRPREPRDLTPDVAEFIARYTPEDPTSVLMVYRQYGWLEAEEFDTAEEAKRYREGGEEYGTFAGEAIVSGKQITVWD